MCLRWVIRLRGEIRLRLMCLRNVSSRGNSSSGGNSSSFNVSSKCVFASSFTYPPWQKCVFEMCLRLRAEKCVHQCAHNEIIDDESSSKALIQPFHSQTQTKKDSSPKTKIPTLPRLTSTISHIGSIWMVYLPTFIWLIFYGFHVGKYTSPIKSMDGMGTFHPVIAGSFVFTPRSPLGNRPSVWWICQTSTFELTFPREKSPQGYTQV